MPKSTKNADRNGSLQLAIPWQPRGAFAQDLGGNEEEEEVYL
jgi:hypothetical protein